MATYVLRPSRSITLGLSLIAIGCASQNALIDNESPPATMPAPSDLVGTWRLISMSEDGKVHQSPFAFYCRFYPDGTAATWPTPNAAVSYGLYKIEDGKLLLPDAPLSDKVEFRLTHSKMWYWNNRGDTCLYYRVEPDLKPGRLP